MEKQTYLLGSEWRKWDLHVHTKDTNKNDQFTSRTFEDFCNEMFKKALEKEIIVIGITDYFSIDNYKKIDEFLKNTLPTTSFFSNEEKAKIENITLIPNVELRMLPATDSGRLINIHCLFNPDYVDKLENDFFATIEYSSGSRKYKMNKNGFIQLGNELGETNNNQAYKIGINNFVVSHSDLQKILDENYEFKNNTIIVVSNSNQDGASAIQKHFDLFENEQNSNLDATRQAIYKLSNMIFSPNEQDKNFFLGFKNGVSKEDVIQKCGSLKPCIHGSDAHKEDKLFHPDSNRYCWIKANPTFEGLKQVIYEPSRVFIGEHRPIEVLHKLEKVELKFNDSKWENDNFCFNDFNNPLRLSPYFTCIIGGRGSGKSTLLNLIANKIDKENQDFFKDLKPNNDIKSKVIFTPKEIGNIEFLAQNTVEEFAKDSKKFTQAIFERIDKTSDGKLTSLENEVTNELDIFDEQIDLLQKKQQLQIDLNSKNKELKKYENIIKTLNNPQLLENNSKLQKLQKEKIELENSRAKYKELYSKIEEIQNSHLRIDEPKNNYEDYYNKLGDELRILFEKYKTKDYLSDIEKLHVLDKDMKKCSEEIRTFLVSQGMNEDNIKDTQSASTNIEIIRNDRVTIIQQLLKTRESLRLFNHQSIDEKISQFKNDVDIQLNTINEKFKEISNKNPNEIKSIKVEYQLDNDIFDIVFDDIVKKLDIGSRISSFKSTFKDYLREVPFDDVLRLKNSLEFIDKIPFKQSQAYNTLKGIFIQNNNFKIYKLVIKKHQRDIKRNKHLIVYYDEKTLGNSSFGQRCTTAIVVLLSLGNNPIIIDEPEAHLDSSLIANYLVELIKEMKQHRQIIFATHNANFVLNGDAEMVIKLEMVNGLTKATSFTIEDLEHRVDLLKLEGGKEAFKKRERKYNII